MSRFSNIFCEQSQLRKGGLKSLLIHELSMTTLDLTRLSKKMFTKTFTTMLYTHKFSVNGKDVSGKRKTWR